MVPITWIIFLYASVLLWQSQFVRGSETLTLKKVLKLEARIIGGSSALKGQFPGLVSMRTLTGFHLCGGTIVSPYYVLTAAHCMFRQNGHRIHPDEILLVAGEIKQVTLKKAKNKRYVCEIILHPDFSWKPYGPVGDITLLKVTEEWEFKKNLHAMEIPTMQVPVNASCQVAGFGDKEEGADKGSSKLKYVDAPIINTSACNEKLIEVYNVNLTVATLCAGHLEGGKDACQGDSGGGLIYKTYVVGVVAGGIGCARPGFPGWFTNVYHYRNWILENMQNSSCPEEEEDLSHHDIGARHHHHPRRSQASTNSALLFHQIIIPIIILYFAGS